ncbi:MAG: hypothetical protein A2Z97_16335 [Bdellovibrionales bacterium GWB1_52_6]|nr:MAG: hypothetical protein A2Z97_16335 [Bdellovibrionales bacterium GWB1_52_6]OFZ03848.1 MAG: hypothetical protein A2X97_15730 [Bdellovibrionales bacterium GWA1_52_35]HCM39717.1 Na(+)/H(+) antiporter subunit A [Bdellovibrionales bacterium]
MGSPTNWLLALIPLLLSVCIAFWIPELSRGEVVRMGTTWVPELNINLSFALDGLSAIFALLITVLGTIVVVYAGPYFENHRDLGRFYVLLLSFMASMLGLVLSDNVILLYIFWELTTFTSFLLIGFENENKEARKNAWQAILVTTAGGLALLAGLLLLGRIGGSYEISTLLANGSTIRDHHLQLPTLILILIGAFTKSAQFPFHFWLPNAMVAPTPVSAYLHSATMVKAGIYLLARFFPIFGNTETWFYVVSTTGVLTMLTGSFMALKQTDLKLLLAYMTIMALGALTLLLGIGNKEAITAAVVFLIAHALYKGALFLVAGSVEHETGTRDVLKLGGLFRKMRLTTLAAVLGAASMAGLPPLLGFIGKELIYKAGLSLAGAASIIFVIIAVVSKATATGVSAILAFEGFFGVPTIAIENVKEVSPGMWLGPCFLGLLSLGFTLFPGFLQDLIIAPAVSAMTGTAANGIGLTHGFELSTPLMLSILSVGLGLMIYSVWRRLLQPLLNRLEPWIHSWGPAAFYNHSVAALMNFARFQTRILQNGNLRSYLMRVFITIGGLTGFTTLYYSSISWPQELPDIAFFVWGILVLIPIGAISAVLATSVLMAVTSLGVVGYAIALVFVFYGAPDLALTQFLVETLTIVLVALLAMRLPDEYDYPLSSMTLVQDAGIAIGFGTVMALVLLTVLKFPFDPYLSNYFAQNSLSSGNGRNIVNVILVDFRAVDTWGEITVLAMSGLGAFALIKFVKGRAISE